MNIDDVERGIGCYTTAVSYVFTDGSCFYVGERFDDHPVGFWLAAIKHPGEPPQWV